MREGSSSLPHRLRMPHRVAQGLKVQNLRKLVGGVCAGSKRRAGAPGACFVGHDPAAVANETEGDVGCGAGPREDGEAPLPPPFPRQARTEGARRPAEVARWHLRGEGAELEAAEEERCDARRQEALVYAGPNERR